MSAWTDLLARFDLSGRWQRLMPSLSLPSNASLEQAEWAVVQLKQKSETLNRDVVRLLEELLDAGDALDEAQAALRNCQGQLQAGSAAPGPILDSPQTFVTDAVQKNAVWVVNNLYYPLLNAKQAQFGSVSV